MKTIYVVTSGSYSDYKIDAIFDNKELAEKFISSFNNNRWGLMDIEEWELNHRHDEIKKGKRAYYVRMDKQGNTVNVEWENSSYGFMDTKNGISFSYDKSIMNCYCFAKDEKHAIKIANERRMQILAFNQWGINN